MSDVASLISDMIREGVSPDIIGRVAEALASRAGAVDAQAERRRAKDRERKARQIPRNSAESAESAELKDVSPTPPSENTPPPKTPLKGVKKVPPQSETEPLEKPIAEAEKSLSGWVSEIWEITPVPARRRSGKAALEAALKAAMRRGDDPERIKAGLAGYYASPDATDQGGKYAKGVDTAIRAGRWEAFADDGATEPIPDDDPWRIRLLRWKAAAYWNSEWGPKPDRPGYLGPPLDIAA